MNKILLFVTTALLSVLATYAQPVLTATNMNPVAGDLFYGHIVDSLPIGTGGANQVWDFRHGNETGLDTTQFFACDSTPYCASFPNSNLAQLNTGDLYYMNAGSDSLVVTGVRSSGVNVWFSDPWKWMKYPMSYHGIYRDTSSAAIAAAGLLHYQTDSFIFDGYGIAMLTYGNDTGVVRIHDITYSFDSGFGFVAYSRTETYNWYFPSFHHVIATVTYDTAGSATGTPAITNAAYYVAVKNTLAIQNVNQSPVSFDAYPNPTSDALQIRINGRNDLTSDLKLTDITGKLLYEVNITDLSAPNHELTIPVSDFPNGMYLVYLQTSNGNISKKVVISR